MGWPKDGLTAVRLKAPKDVWMLVETPHLSPNHIEAPQELGLPMHPEQPVVGLCPLNPDQAPVQSWLLGQSRDKVAVGEPAAGLTLSYFPPTLLYSITTQHKRTDNMSLFSVLRGLHMGAGRQRRGRCTC